MSKVVLFACCTSFLILIPPASICSAQESEEAESSRALVITGSGMYSNTLFHSVGGLTLVQGSIGLEWSLNGFWDFRLSLQPLFAEVSPDRAYAIGWDLDFIHYFGSENSQSTYIEFGGGMAIFDEEFPVENSSRFNVTAFIGGGFVFPFKSRQALILGYRFHHISNNEIGELNPGVNTSLFMVGIRRKF